MSYDLILNRLASLGKFLIFRADFVISAKHKKVFPFFLSQDYPHNAKYILFDKVQKYLKRVGIGRIISTNNSPG